MLKTLKTSAIRNTAQSSPRSTVLVSRRSCEMKLSPLENCSGSAIGLMTWLNGVRGRIAGDAGKGRHGHLGKEVPWTRDGDIDRLRRQAIGSGSGKAFVDNRHNSAAIEICAIIRPAVARAVGGIIEHGPITAE